MKKQISAIAFPASEHNHDTCIADALDAAQENCRQNGLRFTPLRREVLEIVWGRHAPIGAYEILDELRNESRSAAPPTVYRALEFLVENGFVHKIQSLNAFVGCDRPDREHVGQFLICAACKQVGELADTDIAKLIAKKAKAAGFNVLHQTIEVQGLCRNCADAEHA